MKPQSRDIIHMGVNFVISPPPIINRQNYLGFQQALVSHGIEFANAAYKEPKIEVAREAPAPLQIMVGVLVPQPLGQLVIVAPLPARDLEYFIKETEAVVGAFDATWPVQQKQIISCDATLRDLYETTSEHAFKELWETRLGQSPNSLAAFGRPVWGGGLRFVMPPQPNDPKPVQIEVKIESFLRDTKKIFVETQFTWPQSMPPGEPFDPGARLRQVDKYIEDQVLAFISEEVE